MFQTGHDKTANGIIHKIEKQQIPQHRTDCEHNTTAENDFSVENNTICVRLLTYSE